MPITNVSSTTANVLLPAWSSPGTNESTANVVESSVSAPNVSANSVGSLGTSSTSFPATIGTGPCTSFSATIGTSFSTGTVFSASPYRGTSWTTLLRGCLRSVWESFKKNLWGVSSMMLLQKDNFEE